MNSFVRVEGQRRRDVPLDTNYTEQTIGLERAIRMPGKSAIDADLGKAGVNQAENALGDAYHETARLLLRRWFDWQRGQLARHEWQAQAAILQRQLDVAKKRVALGDAARIEQLQAEAQFAQALAQQAQANTAAQLATTEFTQQFPALPLPRKNPPDHAQKTGHSGSKKCINRGSLQLAGSCRQNGWKKSSPITTSCPLPRPHPASSSSSPNVLTPTACLTRPSACVLPASATDKSACSACKSASPCPVRHAPAASRAELAGVNAAAAREAQVKAKVEAEAQRTLIEAEASYRQWEQLAAVSSRMTETAELLDKAWRLGEGQFPDLQFARRQAIDARLAAVRAQADANEAYYRVLLDAHELWAMDEHIDEAGVEQKN